MTTSLLNVLYNNAIMTLGKLNKTDIINMKYSLLLQQTHTFYVLTHKICVFCDYLSRCYCIDVPKGQQMLVKVFIAIFTIRYVMHTTQIYFYIYFLEILKTISIDDTKMAIRTAAQASRILKRVHTRKCDILGQI